LNKKSKFEISGSNSGTTVQEEKVETKEKSDDEKFEELLAALTKIDELHEVEPEGTIQKILDTGMYENGMIENAFPMYVLDVEEDIKWLYSVQRKTYVPIPGGSEVIPVDTEQEGYFCVINNEVFSLEEEWVTCIGWN